MRPFIMRALAAIMQPHQLTPTAVMPIRLIARPFQRLRMAVALNNNRAAVSKDLQDLQASVYYFLEISAS